jgi:hypothetical protein
MRKTRVSGADDCEAMKERKNSIQKKIVYPFLA